MSELITTATKLALFVTDLDNTLVGDVSALKVLNDWLDRTRQEHGTKIVYATGRSLNSYRMLAASAQLFGVGGRDRDLFGLCQYLACLAAKYYSWLAAE
jgi:Sucrose-6F-phosphate phosphohydrolase